MVNPTDILGIIKNQDIKIRIPTKMKKELITGYISNFAQNKPLREEFIYDKKQDRFTCGSAVHFPFKKLTTSTTAQWNFKS